jgi:hypothetical protein
MLTPRQKLRGAQNYLNTSLGPLTKSDLENSLRLVIEVLQESQIPYQQGDTCEQYNDKRHQYCGNTLSVGSGLVRCDVCNWGATDAQTLPAPAASIVERPE